LGFEVGGHHRRSPLAKHHCSLPTMWVPFPLIYTIDLSLCILAGGT